MKIGYVSGPYSGSPHDNTCAAYRVGVQLANAGIYPIIPHMNTFGFETKVRQDYEFFMAGCIRMLQTCDMAVFLPSWRESFGARREFVFAVNHDIEVWLWVGPTTQNQLSMVREKASRMQAIANHIEKEVKYANRQGGR